MAQTASSKTAKSTRKDAVSASAQPSAKPSAKLKQTTKTYVIDTSVLLSDPKAIFKFKEQEVVIPIVVINELEKKRNDPEIGYFARQALRHLDDLRIEHERLDFPIEVGDGGILRVELNHIDQSALPVGFQLGDNDSRILAVAFNLASEGQDVTVVSKDLPMRVKAAALGMNADEYRNDNAVDSGWTGIAELELTGDEMADLYDTEIIKHKAAATLPINTGVILNSERGNALGRVMPGSKIRMVRGDRDVFGVHGRSAEQRLAIDILLDSDIGIVSLGGKAGTGKSALALCAGLEAVLERRQHKKIIVFRPIYAVGGQELGYLPGSENEKMNPWGQAVFDTLGPLVSKEVIEHIVDRGLIEILPLTHIRGR